MVFEKLCMDCGEFFEDNLFYREDIICPYCNSGDVAQPEDDECDYDEATLEDCFCLYHEQNVISKFDADKRQIIFEKEI